jgi:hypothetical protein
MKNKNLKWVLPLFFSILISISVMAFRSGSKIENHSVRIEQNSDDIVNCKERIVIIENQLDKKLDKISNNVDLLIKMTDVKTN